MRAYLFGVVGAVALLQIPGFAEESSARPLGTLMMIGGSHRYSNTMLWSEFARLARFDCRNVALHFLSHGDTIDLDSRRVAPGIDRKLDGHRVTFDFLKDL
jgi:hypothetical protein